jgi:hypothetical protein
VEILDSAVQYIDGMNHPQVTDMRDVHLHRAAGKILDREAGHSGKEIHLFHAAILEAVADLSGPGSRVIERGYRGVRRSGAVVGQRGVRYEKLHGRVTIAGATSAAPEPAGRRGEAGRRADARIFGRSGALYGLVL